MEKPNSTNLSGASCSIRSAIASREASRPRSPKCSAPSVPRSPRISSHKAAVNMKPGKKIKSRIPCSLFFLFQQLPTNSPATAKASMLFAACLQTHHFAVDRQQFQGVAANAEALQRLQLVEKCRFEFHRLADASHARRCSMADGQTFIVAQDIRCTEPIAPGAATDAGLLSALEG